MSDTWYKRSPRDFLDGVQGMGPELIGAYAVILELIYARGGDLPRDDRHLAGVLGCSIRKARALTDGLIKVGKLHLVAGKLTNDRAEKVLNERRNQRETVVKPTRNGGEKAIDMSEINNLTQTDKRREEIRYTHPNGCGADAPDEGFWDFCSRILQRSGIGDREARSLLGKWTKAKGRDEVGQLVSEASRTVDPVAYVESAIMPKRDVMAEAIRIQEERRRAGR